MNGDINKLIPKPLKPKIHIPPIKSQGIKTKLIPWINSMVPKPLEGKWIEPFMGTGVVAFNVAPKSAVLCDSNPHLMKFYQAISVSPNLF